MVFHIFPREKFTVGYINRINRLYNPKNHFFLIYGDGGGESFDNSIIELDNVTYSCMLRGFDKIEEYFKNASSIILHSLPYKYDDLKLLWNLQKAYSKRLAWVLWGGDLYNAYKYNRGRGMLKITPIFNELLRVKLIKSLYMVVSGCDFEELKKRYKTKAIQSTAQYDYKMIKFSDSMEQSDKINVMIGHSATNTCRHIETFNLLKMYSGKINVFCPLSYPADNTMYINKVEEAGRSIFGESFYAIKDFMNYDEYVAFLNKMDIAVFNNSRQQGMGNITSLLLLGKKVYLSNDNTIRFIYKNSDYNIYSVDDIEKDNFLEPLTEEQRESNRKKIEYKFSDENFMNEWNTIFNIGNI